MRINKNNTQDIVDIERIMSEAEFLPSDVEGLPAIVKLPAELLPKIKRTNWRDISFARQGAEFARDFATKVKSTVDEADERGDDAAALEALAHFADAARKALIVEVIYAAMLKQHRLPLEGRTMIVLV